METVSLRKSSQIDVNQRYDEILLMLADAKKRGENFIKVEYLPYELYMKLIEHNYVIQKMKQRVYSFLFLKKTIKYYYIYQQTAN
ncbi:hypothetical protein [Myroides phaeus]|uniref:Uncharacterized protein n=1 Tax=Myroides phaeus TaxID=702745 RepID=A0A1G8GZ62_9FLAO|nr:hypothetical protein [Myroides phaeus]MEC4117036.1 hypothetical protein [Myroides phaeus]SDH99634.1 hypothetical protein SAMN05421818_1363 [Myroides phaeus]